MIYKKDASFSYPILANTSSSYTDNEFFFDIKNLTEKNDDYVFQFEYNIGSAFLKNLIDKKFVGLNLVIQSKDNKFFRLHKYQTEFKVPKNRLSLTNTTTLQLQLQSLREVSFENCEGLNELYNDLKSNIQVSKYTLMGYSNTVTYDGEGTKPLELFETQIDPDIKSSFKVELGTNTVILKFKDSSYLMSDLHKKNIINMYIYEGLSRALYQFIQNFKDDPNEESVDLNSIHITNDDVLYDKLKNLMLSKGIDNLNYEDVDDVIFTITDSIIDKYVTSIREVAENAG